MTTVLKGLTLDTTYYFKIQARNNKGYGPLSSEIAFHTAPGKAYALLKIGIIMHISMVFPHIIG